MEETLLRLSRSDNTILITGRTGTGKSHLAREIHGKSKRAEKRFIAINLATLSDNLIESELFGHERGAFSGADQKRVGKLESGNDGTVFLDEIGELSLRLQTKLLEALNSKTISPVGSNREIRLNIRIIAATNRDLTEMVRAGTFREDLYFRLNTFQVDLPNLHEQSTRLSALIDEFGNAAAKAQGERYYGHTDDYRQAVLQYNWPGNIRELKNTLDFGIAISSDGKLNYLSLPPYIRKNLEQAASATATEVNFPRSALAEFPTNYYESKARFERLYLEEMLRRFEGKINLTARSTNLSKVTLIEKIRKYEINVNRIKFAVHSGAN